MVSLIWRCMNTCIFSLICSICPASIRRIQCIWIADKHLYFNCIDVLLLYCGYQHVSATHVTIFRVTWEQEYNCDYNASKSLCRYNNHIISGYNSEQFKPSTQQHRPAIWIIIHLMYLLCSSLNILQTVLNILYFTVIHILFSYSTVNFNQKLWSHEASDCRPTP
jgi:hypothetical protein